MCGILCVMSFRPACKTWTTPAEESYSPTKLAMSDASVNCKHQHQDSGQLKATMRLLTNRLDAVALFAVVTFCSQAVASANDELPKTTDNRNQEPEPTRERNLLHNSRSYGKHRRDLAVNRSPKPSFSGISPPRRQRRYSTRYRKPLGKSARVLSDGEKERDLSLAELLCLLSQNLCILPDYTRSPSQPPVNSPSGPSPQGPTAPIFTLPLTFYQNFGIGKGGSGRIGKRRRLPTAPHKKYDDRSNATESTKLYRSDFRTSDNRAAARAGNINSDRKLVVVDDTENDLSGRSMQLLYNGPDQAYTVVQGPSFDNSFSFVLSHESTLVYPVALDFTMPLPFTNPPSANSIDIGFNGWIGFTGGSFNMAGSAFAVTSLLAEPASLAVFWEGFNILAGGTVYFDFGRFDENGIEFVMVTWHNVCNSGLICTVDNANTFQAKLKQNGDISFTWGNMAITTGLVGLSQGFVSPIDISEVSVGSKLPTTFHELFSSSNTFDLGGNPGQSIELVYTGPGVGYTVAQGPDYTPPTTERSTSSSNQLFENEGLGFEMPLPFPPFATTSIDIDTNGWIGLVGGCFTSTESFPSVEGFLTDNPRVAVFWSDLDPSSAEIGGGLFLDRGTDSESVDYVLITWQDVRGADVVDGALTLNTFQVKLRQNGNIVLTYGRMESENGLVGVSAGPLDISAVIDLL